MTNPWILHIKAFASKNNITYGCALSDPQCKSSYKKGAPSKIVASSPIKVASTKVASPTKTIEPVKVKKRITPMLVAQLPKQVAKPVDDSSDFADQDSYNRYLDTILKPNTLKKLYDTSFAQTKMTPQLREEISKNKGKFTAEYLKRHNIK